MNREPDESPAEFADRVDQALEELWRGGSAQFSSLLDEEGSAGINVGEIFGVIGIQGQADAEFGPGTRIAQYEIIREIGRGGMGVVYEAQQQHPSRRVALKVIREQGPVDALHVKLFQREVNTLARLKHPGIAAIYDAGRTENGRHFFAMELIPGENLLDYANARATDSLRRPLGTRERLDLFCKISDAVNYAHQRGVIHRDLKPSNVLVGDESGSRDAAGSSASAGFSSLGSQVKVLDFGLAHITDADADQTTLLTETGRIVGTLSYMSPEQARGDADAIDLRSDVYALGVILYELLTGQLPYEINRAAPHQALRTICEDAPHKPSMINHALRGDLETIMLKALEKGPDRRYQNAAALADDIRRQLSGQPILARPPSAAYQIRKLVTRHKIPAGLLGLLAAAVVAFAVITAVQADRLARQRDRARLAQQSETQARAEAEQARDQAQTEAEKARQIQSFLQDMLASVDPGTAQGRDVGLLKDLLADAARRVETDLFDQPEVAAAVRTTIGRTYAGLGLYDEAEPHLRAALQFCEAHYGEHDLMVAPALDNVGLMLTRRGAYAEAEALLRRALGIRTRQLDEDHVDLALSYNHLGILLGYVHRYDEAEELLREAVEIRRRELGPGDHLTARSVGDLAWLLGRREDLDAAAPLFREALETARRLYGDEHPDTAMCLNNLAGVLKKMGKYAEAAELFGESLAIQRRVLGEDHPDLAEGLIAWGDLLRRQGKYAQAEPLFREAVNIQRKHLGEENDFYAAAIGHLAGIRIKQGDYATGESLYRRALEIYRKIHGDRHMTVLVCRNGLGTIFVRTQRYTEAEAMFREVLELFRELHGNNHPGVAVFTSNLASVLTHLGEFDEAETLFREVLAFRREFYGAEHPKVAATCYTLAGVLLDQNELTEAEALLRQALAVQRKIEGNSHPNVGKTLTRLGALLVAKGDTAAAASVYREADDIHAQALPEEHPRPEP
ncbi:MAG: serine/threonine protein kinase [Phycisphaerae bacterium]|nr:serine/threonine protein kinase [Phycisphaerae bacterium]